MTVVVWRTGRGNRDGLTVVALVLLGRGLPRLLPSVGAVGAGSARAALPTRAETSCAHDNASFWPVTAAVAGLLAFLCRRWLVQLRHARVRAVQLEPDAAPVASEALISAPGDEVLAYGSLPRVAARLGADPAYPDLRLILGHGEGPISGASGSSSRTRP